MQIDFDLLENSLLLPLIDAAYTKLIKYWIELQTKKSTAEGIVIDGELFEILQIGLDSNILLLDSVENILKIYEDEKSPLQETMQFVQEALIPIANYITALQGVPYENCCLNEDELVTLAITICEHYHLHQAEERDLDWVYVKKKRDTKAARSFFVNRKNKDVIVLSKTKKGVKALGYGSYKKISEAIFFSYADNKVEIVAQASLKEQYYTRNSHERFILSPYHQHLEKLSFHAIPECCLRYISTTKDGKQIQKITTFQKKFPLDLFDLIELSAKKQVDARGLKELTFERQINIIEKLASALFALHTYKWQEDGRQKAQDNREFVGFVHGDIKVENILLDIDEKGDYVPYLADFDTLIPAVQAHQRAAKVGTSTSYSPELLCNGHQDAQAVGKVRDVYALGLVYYMAITKKPIPWSGHINANDVGKAVEMQQIIGDRITIFEEELKKQNDSLRTLALEIAILVHRMLHPQLTLRFTAEQLLQDVKKIAATVVQMSAQKVDFSPVSTRLMKYLP